MSNSVFGTPKFGNSGGEYKKTRAVGAGDTFFRPLPPMFSLRDLGEWRKYFATHWGYEAVSERDPSKTFQKPFRCIFDKDRRTGLVRQECPACTKREAVEKELADMEKAIREEMKVKDEAVIVARLNKQLDPTRQWLDDHRVDGKWYVNAKFKDGTFGSIKLNHKFHMSRMMEIINGRAATATTPEIPSLLEAEGINPLDPAQGVWFVVHRTGSKRNVVDTLDIEMENVIAEVEVNGQKQKRTLKQIVLAPLTEEECEKAGKECEDLATLGGAVLSYEQIDALVNGVGDSDVVEPEVEPANSDTGPDLDASDEQAASLKRAEEATFTKAAEEAAQKTQKEAIQKRLAEIKAKQAVEAAKKAAAEEAARKAAAEVAKAAPPADVDDFANMSDEEFARKFGTGA